MRSDRFVLSLPANVLDNLQKVAAANHLKDTQFSALVLSKFSDLRPEHALDAIACIPKEFFRRGPGRPAGSRDDQATP